MRFAAFYLVALATIPSLVRAQGPVFAITPEESSIKFYVKSSVDLTGTFEKWDASLNFPSRNVETGVLEIKIHAASVNTGSGMKDKKLKSKDFFNVEEDPFITFQSTKAEQTGSTTFNVYGNFTIRGVSKPETLTLAITGKGTGSGTIRGTMAFDRKDFGMTSGIPFIKIADRVEVTVGLKATQIGGPRLIYKE
jgi:polyisoprenoid-binding protein YceI